MSSFDRTAGKNLDEILASIRKTLADESPYPETSAGELNSSAQAKASASVNHNGLRAAADKIDEDLADLLAGSLGIPAPASGPKQTPDAATDQKDPLWFLRSSGGGESQVVPLPADRISPSFEALVDGPATPPPERSSLAQLFVADNGSGSGQPAAAATDRTPPPQASATPAMASAAEPRTPDETKPAAKAPPRDAAAPANAGQETVGGSPPPEVERLSGSAATKAPSLAATSAAKADLAKPGVAPSEPAAIGPAAAPLEPPGPIQPHATTAVPRPAEPGKPAAAATGAPLRAALGNSVGSPIKSGSVTPRATALNGAALTATPPAAASPAAAGATMVPTTQTQALEQIIEQLLEPLLRRWVEANLPRLVDAAIRAEVARALDRKHRSGQDADRKV